MWLRIKNGEALSSLDGQFILVKDKIPAKGYKIRNGLEQNPNVSDVDAVLVEKAKSFGLIPIGITNMTQLGLSGIGYNSSKYHSTCKNPLNPKFYTSGSSNGTAAGIASGLAPYGFGTDGGGSIRNPACYCGIFGLKPTHGRYSLHNAFSHGLKIYGSYYMIHIIWFI